MLLPFIRLITFCCSVSLIIIFVLLTDTGVDVITEAQNCDYNKFFEEKNIWRLEILSLTKLLYLLL